MNYETRQTANGDYFWSIPCMSEVVSSQHATKSFQSAIALFEIAFGSL